MNESNYNTSLNDELKNFYTYNICGLYDIPNSNILIDINGDYITDSQGNYLEPSKEV